MTLYRRAAWGPLSLVTADDRVEAWVSGSADATIVAPSGHGYAEPALRSRLADGLPVLLDGEPALTLVQPRRGWLRREDRVIEVHGPAELVPPGDSRSGRPPSPTRSTPTCWPRGVLRAGICWPPSSRSPEPAPEPRRPSSLRIPPRPLERTRATLPSPGRPG